MKILNFVAVAILVTSLSCFEYENYNDIVYVKQENVILNPFSVKLNYNLNISHIHKNMKDMLLYQNKLKDVCLTLKNPSTCEYQVKLLEYATSNLRLHGEKFKKNIGSRRRRSAKGWMDFANFLLRVGIVASIMFGIHEFTKSIDQQVVQHLQKIDRENREMIKKQTLLTNNSVNVFMNSVVDVADHINKLQDKLMIMDKNQNAFERASGLIGILITMFTETILFAGNIDDILFHKSPHHITKVIGEEVIRNDLFMIQDTFDLDRKFPTNILHDGISEILSLSKINTSKENEIVRIEFEIPVITNEKFSLFKAIPIPHMEGNQTFILDVLDENIAWNPATNHSKIINTQTLNTCVRLKSNELMCRSLSDSKESSNCVLNSFPFYYGPKFATCKKIKVKNESVVTHIIDDVFQFFIMKPQILNMNKCNGSNENIELKNSSFIKLDGVCKFKFNQRTISLNSNVLGVFVKKIVMKNELPILNTSYVIENWGAKKLDFNRTFVKLKTHINDVNEVIEKPIEDINLPKNLNSIFYDMLSIVTMFCVFVLIIKIISLLKHK